MTSRLHRVVLRSPKGSLTRESSSCPSTGRSARFLTGVGRLHPGGHVLRGPRAVRPVPRVPSRTRSARPSSSTDFAWWNRDLAPLTSPESLSGLDPSAAAQRSARCAVPRVLVGAPAARRPVGPLSRRSTPSACHDPHARGRAIRTGMATGKLISRSGADDRGPTSGGPLCRARTSLRRGATDAEDDHPRPS